MDNFKSKKIIGAVLCVALALASVLVVAKPMTSLETHSETIASLDAKKETVMELTAASTAASAAITLIPGDVATPIADKVADLSGWFLIVLCAIFLEKYLVIIAGYASWYLLIPVGLLLLASWFVMQKGGTRAMVRQIATKLIVLGLAIALVIPASVKASAIIEETYATSIQQTIDSATQATQDIEDAAQRENKKGLNIISNITQGVSGAMEEMKMVVNRFMEAIAVMVVTSCIVPVVVLLFFVWVVKAIIGVKIPGPKPKGLMPRTLPQDIE